jgi:hypothetical protein
MLTEQDKVIVRLGAYIAALEQAYAKAQAELAELKAKAVKEDSPEK